MGSGASKKKSVEQAKKAAPPPPPQAEPQAPTPVAVTKPAASEPKPEPAPVLDQAPPKYDEPPSLPEITGSTGAPDVPLGKFPPTFFLSMSLKRVGKPGFWPCV